MSFFWGLSTNKYSKIECALSPFAREISFSTGDSGAWGLGCYTGGEPLQRIEPREKGVKLEIEEISREIRADIIIMHTRMATVGRMRRENIHPFRFKEWLFAHNGTLTGFDDYRDKLVDAMPPFILRSLAGDTDSEHLFHLFLSFLYDGNRLGRPDPGVSVIRDALARAVKTTHEFCREAGHAPAPGSMVVSDGYSLVVLSAGVPVDYVLIEGIRDCAVCRNSIRPGQEDAATVDHEDLRAVLVRSGSLEEAPPQGFLRLDKDSFIGIDREHRIEISSLV